MDVLMLVWTDVSTDARVQREAATLAEFGHRVHVIGRAVADGYVPPPGVTVESAGVAPTGIARRRRLPAPLRLARWLLLPHHVARALRRWVAQAEPLARARRFDVVHAHDFTALPLGARLARERGVPLVYDAHEFWPGRPRSSRPAPLRHLRELRAERRLGGSAAAVLTVGPAVAELLRRKHGWPHVEVVRNTFPMPPAGDGPRPGPPEGLVYAGRIAAHRELEVVVQAAPALRPLTVDFVGPADESYLAGFDRGLVEVGESLPLDVAAELLRARGLALVTHSDRWINNRVALPNKLFLAVVAGVPVVATDVPELRREVVAHDLGALYPPGDVAGLVAAVQRVVADYDRYAANVAAARPELSWDKDAAVLRDVYARLGEPVANSGSR